MELRYKVVLLAVAPLVLTAGAVALAITYEGRVLAERQVAETERILLAAKQDELRDLVKLARGAIRSLEGSGRDDPETRARALEVLRGLDFGQDGYFYVYELDGRNLMHARMPQLEGRDQLRLTDDIGQPVIQQVLARGRAGGGFVRYRWSRPSQQRWGYKLGYVELLPRWGWILGTGIYLDDVEAVTRQIRASSAAAVGDAMRWIAAAAILAAAAAAALAWALNATQRRFANPRLRDLNRQVVDMNEAARARMAGELHAGVMHELRMVLFELEAALDALEPESARAALAPGLERGQARLAHAMAEIRRACHELRPRFDERRLSAALERLGVEIARRSGLMVTVDAPAVRWPLSPAAALVLLRVAQEALANVARHAGASRAQVCLAAGKHRGTAGTCLTVRDDGRGFDIAAAEGRVDGGIGLANMREQVEALSGRFAICSGSDGTEIQAFLPEEVPAAPGAPDEELDGAPVELIAEEVRHGDDRRA